MWNCGSSNWCFENFIDEKAEDSELDIGFIQLFTNFNESFN